MTIPTLEGWNIREKKLMSPRMDRQFFATPHDRTLTTFVTHEKRASAGWKHGKLQEITYEALVASVLLPWYWDTEKQKWLFSGVRVTSAILKPKRDLDDPDEFYASGWRAGYVGDSYFASEDRELPNLVLPLIEATRPRTRIIFQEVPE